MVGEVLSKTVVRTREMRSNFMAVVNDASEGSALQSILHEVLMVSFISRIISYEYRLSRKQYIRMLRKRKFSEPSAT